MSVDEFILKYDNVLRIEYTNKLKNQITKNQKWKNLTSESTETNDVEIGGIVIKSLIEECLKNRTSIVNYEVTTSDTQTNHHPSKTFLRFGIVINRENAFKFVEKAQTEDPIISKSFKEFWGDKSQLRRFMDGTLIECVSFEYEEKDRIIFQMLKYTFNRHLNYNLDEEDYLDSQLEKILQPQISISKFIEKRKKKNGSHSHNKKIKLTKEISSSTSIEFDEITSLASKSFDGLSKILRQLEGLPLLITSVQGTSPILRFTNVYPNPPQLFHSSKILTEPFGSGTGPSSSYNKIKEGDTLNKVPRHVEPIGIVVQLEGSGKWPDDIKAIDRLKSAFLIRIGQLLQEEFGLTVQFYPKFIYVLKDGFIFKISLTYFRELILLKQLRGDDGILRIRDNPISSSLERDTLLLPQLTTILHSIHRQFGGFGKTCQLAKRWISSHHLLAYTNYSNIHHPDPRFTEESIELLVCYLFLEYSPYESQPNQPQIGFLRFLNLLGSTNWKSTPIILNFNSKLSNEDINQIKTNFQNKRQQLPFLFISTPEDQHSSIWTKYLSQSILLRSSVLAKFALNSILNDLNSYPPLKYSDPSLKWKKLFQPSTRIYDVLIWIKKDMIGRRNQSSDPYKLKFKYEEYKKEPNEKIPIVDFDPVELYLKELRETFGNFCTFLNDVYGGNYIGILWNQIQTQDRDFEVSKIRGRKLKKDKKRNKSILIFDKKCILEEIEFMGKGIVDNVEINYNLNE